MLVPFVSCAQDVAMAHSTMAYWQSRSKGLMEELGKEEARRQVISHHTFIYHCPVSSKCNSCVRFSYVAMACLTLTNRPLATNS